MQMKYTTILFDFDGTIQESGPCILAAMRAAFARMGLMELAKKSDLELSFLVGPPLREGFGSLKEMPPHRIGEAMELYRELAGSEEALALLRPYAGIPALLAALRNQGVKVGMATAKRRDIALQHLVVIDLLDAMDYVGAPLSDDACDKAAIIKEAMEALGADPAGTVMVGDRLYDMEAARRAGIPGVGVLYGYGSREELEAHGATHIVESVERLSELLGAD